MNKTLLILTLPILLVSSIVLTDLYTTSQLNSATESLASSLEWQTGTRINGEWTPWSKQPSQETHD